MKCHNRLQWPPFHGSVLAYVSKLVYASELAYFIRVKSLSGQAPYGTPASCTHAAHATHAVHARIELIYTCSTWDARMSTLKLTFFVWV
jgi:hypothetical protein